MKTLIAVESPHKAKLISGFLGKDYIVLPTVGHFLEMPNPKRMTKEEKKQYGNYSMDLSNNFEPLWKTIYGKNKTIQSFKEAMKKVDEIVIASDADDQGSLIGLLLIQTLKPKIPTYRATWNEITKKAVKEGLKNKQLINTDKKEPTEFFNGAEAALTQSSWDRLFGFTVSPYLWKIMKNNKLSAGRVQTPAARLIVEKEIKRLQHTSISYYTITGDFNGIKSTLFELKGRKIAGGAQIDDDGNVKNGYTLITDKNVDKLLKFLEKQHYEISDVSSKPYTRKPQAPFTTSTALQSIGNKTGLSTKAITSILQELYANEGKITYIRTVSVEASDEAIVAARKTLEKKYGKKYVPQKKNVYKDKKQGNSGHECLRNVVDDSNGLLLEAKFTDNKKQKVFNIISKRMLASQSINATGTTYTAIFSAYDTEGKATSFRSSETEIQESGWTKIYAPDNNDENENNSNNSKIKKLIKGEKVNIDKISKEEHKTMPPARFTENNLISKLDDLGIGRPSSFASMVSVIQERDYVRKIKGNTLVPTFRGFAMMNIMIANFDKYINYGYTAEMEEKIDEIIEGKQNRPQFLSDFWFGQNNDGFDNFVKDLLKDINWEEIKKLSTIDLHNGYSIVYNSFGSFLQDNNGELNDKGYLPSAKIDDDGLIEDYLDIDECKKLIDNAKDIQNGPKELGILENGEYKGWKVVAKTGRYGDYVQALPPENKKSKPVNHTLKGDLTVDNVELKNVEELFAEVKLPRWSNDGKYLVGINKKGGKYIGYKSSPRAKKLKFQNLPDEYDPRTIDFDTVIELFKNGEKKTKDKKDN